MPSFIRHKLGNGKKFDESEACSDSILCQSEIHGETHCFHSNLLQSIVKGSYLANSLIHKSFVENSIIADSQINKSTVVCHSVTNSNLENSHLLGESIISKSVIKNSKFSNLIVSNANIIDWDLLNLPTTNFQFARITSGTWRIPPRIHRFEDLNMTVTESTNGQALIGCIEKPMSEWIKCGDRFGRAKGWLPHHVALLKEIFAEWIIKTPQNS